MADTSFCPTPSQVIEAKYLNQNALIRLLRRVYGDSDGGNNFRVEVYLSLWLTSRESNVTLSYGLINTKYTS